MFDWLVTDQIVPDNSATSVRGPKHSARCRKTAVLAAVEAWALLDSLPIETISGLRDRALLGLMVNSFTRIGAALGIKVEDVYARDRLLCVRLHEKGGKRHEMPICLRQPPLCPFMRQRELLNSSISEIMMSVLMRSSGY